MGNFVLIFLGTIAVVWYAGSNDANSLNEVIVSVKEDQLLTGVLVPLTAFVVAQPFIFFVAKKGAAWLSNRSDGPTG